MLLPNTLRVHNQEPPNSLDKRWLKRWGKILSCASQLVHEVLFLLLPTDWTVVARKCFGGWGG